MSDLRLSEHHHLDEAQVTRVLALLAAAADDDGVQPLSEHVYLHLRHGGDVADHNLLAWRGDDLVGYAHLDPTDAVEGASAELVVAPAARRHAVGAQIVARLEAMTPGGRLRLWAHGALPGAAALAARLGYEQARALWQMRRSLYAPLPAAALPPGIEIRTFRPGADDEAWVSVNAATFAAHPDQGGWTLEELRLRTAEAWFDPAGFFLAERDSRLVGFHWTKVHGASEHLTGPHGHGHAHDAGDGHVHDHAHDPIGEVYVVGVLPDEQGNGLGKALTLVGLHHLRSLGLAQAMLYVDEENAPAIALYERLGFTRWDTDVSYRREWV